MRIAINTRFLLKNRLEGIGRFTYEVSQRLADRRPDDEFIFLFDRPFDSDFITHANIKAVVIPPPARHPFLWYLWFEYAIPYALRKNKADVFISMDAYCSLRTKVPTLMVTHDIAHVHYREQTPFLTGKYYHHFSRPFLRKAEQVVTVSHFYKQDIIQHYGIEASKISVACNGVQPHFQPIDDEIKQTVRIKWSEGQAYFFYIGAIHPRKNIVRLIQAFDQFKIRSNSEAKLLIAGRFAWQTSGIKTAFDQAQFKQDVHFLGYVSDKNLPDLIGAALALTYVSLFEGFGVPIIEAMQAGVAVICSNVSSMPEVGGNAALLVDPKDVEDIAFAMSSVYEKQALRQSMIAKGKIHCQQFTWDKATDVVENAMMKLSS